MDGTFEPQRSSAMRASFVSSSKYPLRYSPGWIDVIELNRASSFS